MDRTGEFDCKEQGKLVGFIIINIERFAGPESIKLVSKALKRLIELNETFPEDLLPGRAKTYKKPVSMPNHEMIGSLIGKKHANSLFYFYEELLKVNEFFDKDNRESFVAELSFLISSFEDEIKVLVETLDKVPK